MKRKSLILLRICLLLFLFIILLSLYVVVSFQTVVGLCGICGKAYKQEMVTCTFSNPNDESSKIFKRETYTDTGVSKFLNISCDKCRINGYDTKYRGLFGDTRLLGSGHSYHKWLIWGNPEETEKLFNFFKEYEKTHPELREMMLKCLKDPSAKEVEVYKTKIYDAWEEYKKEHEKK